jgi:hypothetical protein
MKQALERLVQKAETQEKPQFTSTVAMILLFLVFWGASFYVLVNSFA